MKIAVCALCFLFTIGFTHDRSVVRLVKVTIPSHDVVYSLKEFDIVDAGDSYATMLVTDRELVQLRARGYPVTILIWDYRAYKDDLFSRGFYRTYAQLGAALDSLATDYPNICRLDTIGSSVQGRVMWAMRVSDNPNVEEAEPEIRLLGNIHGDEHIGTEITLYFLRYLLTNYSSNPQVQDLVNNREIWVLPTLNPDGKVANDRYNANGIDLNRDYGYFWDGWGGSPGPSSQIENKVAMQHLEQNDISLEYNYHSTAEYVNYPWDYHFHDPVDSQHIIILSEIYADSANLTAINGYDWYQVNGSLQDYTIGTTGALAWTIETLEPSGSSAIDQICYDNRDALMSLCERAGWGIEGVVEDSVTGDPVCARIEVLNPERIDVYGDPVLGDFHKMIAGGTYDVRVSANGYTPKILSDVTVPSSGSTDMGIVSLAPNQSWLYAVKIAIVRYRDHAEESNRTRPRFALGPSDNRFFSLGQDGFIVLDMGVSTPIIDIGGDDFTVYEGDDGADEGYSVFASNSWDGPWNSCGTGNGTSNFDLANAGMAEARYLRIVDDNSASSGQFAGFDLDAVRFFASLTGLPAIPQIVKPLAFVRLPDLQPVLTFFSIDPQGEVLQYRVLWDSDPMFGSADSATTGTYPSGSQVHFTIPTPLTDSVTYWWKVKCTDPTGSGLWTPYTNRRSLTIETSLPESTCTWFQTTATQFAENTLNGTIIQGDSVILSPTGQPIIDTLFEEYFEAAGIPPGWSVIDGNGDGSEWEVGTTSDLSSYTPPNYGTRYAFYSDDDAGSGSISYNEELISPPVFVPAGISNLEIVYGYGFRVYQTGEKYRVKIRTKSGASWGAWSDIAIYAANGSGTEVIDLTAYLPCDSVQFDWFFSDSTSSSHWGWACACDNVVLRYSYTNPNDYGSMTGLSVVYHELATTYARSHWGNAVWHKATAGDSIGIQVEYYNGTTWQLIPDGDLPGNASGFYSNLPVDSIDMHTLDTTVYHTVRLIGHFQRIVTENPDEPALLDWEVGNLSTYVGISEERFRNDQCKLSIYPTITTGAVVIAYEMLAFPEYLAITIYDVSGRLVRSFTDHKPQTADVITWQRRDKAGRIVPAGIYFIKFESDTHHSIRKIILLK